MDRGVQSYFLKLPCPSAMKKTHIVFASSSWFQGCPEEPTKVTKSEYKGLKSRSKGPTQKFTNQSYHPTKQN